MPPTNNPSTFTTLTYSMNLGAQITNPLLGHLTQLEEILEDANPTNDVGDCNKLSTFVTFVNERRDKGEISATNASALVESAGDIAYALDCG